MINIPLSRGLSTIVDDDVSDAIKSKKWYADKGNKEKTKFYATSYIRQDGKKVKVYLHRVIVGAAKGQYVDHINGDTLDNREENLRICSTSENQMNRNIISRNFSGHKGVSYERKSGLWTARIKKEGKSYWLGRFRLKEDAVNAYASSARKLFGGILPYSHPQSRSRVMRTREEQIEAVAIEWVEETGWGDGVSHDRARQIILEAERRAEQRVRAEIGRDSERLDWLENTRSVVLQDANNGWRVTISGVEFSLMKETARNAIDAARENNND